MSSLVRQNYSIPKYHKLWKKGPRRHPKIEFKNMKVGNSLTETAPLPGKSVLVPVLIIQERIFCHLFQQHLIFWIDVFFQHFSVTSRQETCTLQLMKHSLTYCEQNELYCKTSSVNF